MAHALKWIRWFGWTLWYIPQSQPKEFRAYIKFASRTWKPWWKFRPYTRFDDNWNAWEVRFHGEGDYTSTETVKCEVFRDFETDAIVGFRFFKSDLDKPSARRE